jgi:hypothetical protein
MLLVDGVRFRQWKASSEDEYESYVVANAKVVFGEDSHYFERAPLAGQTMEDETRARMDIMPNIYG